MDSCQQDVVWKIGFESDFGFFRLTAGNGQLALDLILSMIISVLLRRGYLFKHDLRDINNIGYFQGGRCINIYGLQRKLF